MLSVEEWKRRIVKFFVVRSPTGVSYRITSETELYKQFANSFETNTQVAYDELFSSGIIEEILVNRKSFYALNFTQKLSEIESIIKDEPFGSKFDLIRPTDKEFQGLKLEFQDVGSKGLSNKGFYYFCTKITDPSYWIVLIKTRPNVIPYKIILGSTDNKTSRIMKIWHAVMKVSKINKGNAFIKKWVENIEQEACGNNRLPSKSAFEIFVHLGWLEVTRKKGNIVYYKITRIGSR